jgi:hypothetical protein
METLEITVTTRREAEKLAEELKKKPQVKAVEVLLNPAKASTEVDPVTLASEASLAESWDSPEDARWDDLLR